jgi:hypothetical protein
MDDADDWDAFINPSGSEDEVANITPHAGGGDPAASGADVTGGKPARAAPLQLRLHHTAGFPMEETRKRRMRHGVHSHKC